MGKKQEWRPGEFVRYLAGNCDSERLIEKFDESCLVRNAIEYLERRSPWEVPFIDGIRQLKEIPHPDLIGRERIDLGMKSIRGDKWGMLLEAKWIDKGRGAGDYAREVFADVFRLASLKTDLAEGAHRYMLIAGPKSYFEKFLDYAGVARKGVRRIGLLHSPIVGKIVFSKALKVDTQILEAKFPELVAAAQKRFGDRELPGGLKTMLEGRSASSIGETRNDEPVHVRLWRVLPWDNGKAAPVLHEVGTDDLSAPMG